MTFGEFFRTKRIESGATLRNFCLKHGYDPGNISKLERGVLAPPQSEEKLCEYAKSLGLKKNTDDFISLLDLAFEESRASQIKSGVRNISDKQLIEKLPLLFRTLDNSNLTDDKLNQIIKLAQASSAP